MKHFCFSHISIYMYRINGASNKLYVLLAHENNTLCLAVKWKTVVNMPDRSPDQVPQNTNRTDIHNKIKPGQMATNFIFSERKLRKKATMSDKLFLLKNWEEPDKSESLTLFKQKMNLFWQQARKICRGIGDDGLKKLAWSSTINYLSIQDTIPDWFVTSRTPLMPKDEKKS